MNFLKLVHSSFRTILMAFVVLTLSVACSPSDEEQVKTIATDFVSALVSGQVEQLRTHVYFVEPSVSEQEQNTNLTAMVLTERSITSYLPIKSIEILELEKLSDQPLAYRALIQLKSVDGQVFKQYFSFYKIDGQFKFKFDLN
ncbi:MAG: hypothetical protein KGV48_002095 [Alcaligenaceae bacterium]|nr:hypothetical protein [Alcaligenaceae bacterium]